MLITLYTEPPYRRKLWLREDTRLVYKSSAHRPPKATPPSLGQAAIAASRSQSGPSTSLTRDHAPDPGLSSFLTESRHAELWPRPQRGPAPATPPSDLKRLGLRLTYKSRALGVGRC